MRYKGTILRVRWHVYRYKDGPTVRTVGLSHPVPPSRKGLAARGIRDAKGLFAGIISDALQSTNESIVTRLYVRRFLFRFSMWQIPLLWKSTSLTHYSWCRWFKKKRKAFTTMTDNKMGSTFKITNLCLIAILLFSEIFALLKTTELQI